MLTDRPPAGQSGLVFAFDPDLGAGQSALLVGSGVTVTVTSATRTAGPPAFYSFTSGQRITFGDFLDAYIAGASAKFTGYFAINPQGTEVSAGTPSIAFKRDASNIEFQFFLNSGKPRLQVFYGNVATTKEGRLANSALSVGRQVVAFTFDCTQAVDSRLVLYGNAGVLASATDDTASPSGSISDTTAAFGIGDNPGGLSPLGIISYCYGYGAVHDAATVAANIAWITGSGKGWA